MRATRLSKWAAAALGAGVLILMLAEVSAIVWVAGEIGWWTILLLLFTTVLGVVLTAREWGKAWQALSNSLSSGQLPAGRLTDASLVLAGGILLMAPGFITDLIGLFLLLPFTRPFVRSAITWWATRKVTTSSADNTVIKGEATVVETMIPPPTEDQ